MPIVKNTLTGNNYLEKINTEADSCSATAVRSYDKQLGSKGRSNKTVFDLPFTYDPNSHTLWVFVNGVKAEAVDIDTGNKLDYMEISSMAIKFCATQNDNDEIQFIVAGSYIGDNLDYSMYIKTDGSVPFMANQTMADNKLTELADGEDPKDAVNLGQVTELMQNIDLTKYIKKDGTVPFEGNQSIGNWKLTNLAKGVDELDAVNLGQLSEYVDRPQLYTVLESYGLAKVDWFTYSKDEFGVDTYGTPGYPTASPVIPARPVTNDMVQYYTIPDFDDGQVIKVHCWGANGGGYAYGELVIKKTGYVVSNPSHVKVGDVICVHVGQGQFTGYLTPKPIGRAAIWRYGTAYFYDYTHELLVAGGNSGGTPGGGNGGQYNQPNNATGGTQIAGGVCPGSSSGNGIRVFGGYHKWNTCDGWKASIAGDGYYGGGAGTGTDYQNDGCRHIAGGSGGGSNFFAPSMLNAFTVPWAGGTYPPYANIAAWGMNAGCGGNPGRVAFEITLGGN